MKTIYKSFLAIAAILMLTNVASAQNLDVPYKVTNGIGYNKSVTPVPDPDTGEYTVRLETFATGDVRQSKPIPADIILVLDVSGSMSGNMPDNFTSLGEQSYSFDSYSDNQYYYKDSEGEYHLVQRGSRRGNRRTYYYLYYVTPYGYYNNFYTFLDNSGISQEWSLNDSPTTVTSSSGIIWTGELYVKENSEPVTKMAALKESVKKFIDIVKEKDADLELKEGEIGNQISIVRFAGTSTNSISENTDMYQDGQYNYTSVVKQFLPVRSMSTEIWNAANSLQPGGATSVDYGLDLAERLYKDLDSTLPAKDGDGKVLRSRTVVVFTDGEPNHHNGFDNTVAVSAVNIAKRIKATKIEDLSQSEINAGKVPGNATVFTVGVFNISDGTTKNKVDAYMSHVSSNYPKASASTSGSGSSSQISYTGSKEDDMFYEDASSPDSNLSEIFESIANHASGDPVLAGGTSLLALDIVSSSFSLPDGVSVNDVTVYTAQCLGTKIVNNKKYLAFAEPKEYKSRPPVPIIWIRGDAIPDSQGHEPDSDEWVPTYEWIKRENADIDENISVVPDEENNSISVTGFNYSDYWCGYDEQDLTREEKNSNQYDSSDPNYGDYKPGYRGFKIIIEFPIKVNETAVGGPSVKTNERDSGIYLTDDDGKPVGEPLVRFNQPNVVVPVNLWIKKYGLMKGENAKFHVLRKPVTDGSAWESKPFTTFVITGTGDVETVTGEDGKEMDLLVSPTFKMGGLNPHYYYKVVEEGWSWSYGLQNVDGITTDLTTETLLENPIKIINKKADTSIKHAESKAINVFGTYKSAESIDSREFFDKNE